MTQSRLVDCVVLVIALAIVVPLVMPMFRSECMTPDGMQSYEKFVMAALTIVSAYLGMRVNSIK